MSLNVLVALFALLIALVSGCAVDPNCPEENATLYYVGADSAVYYLPNGDFAQKQQLDIGGEFEPFTLSYNHQMKSLLFMDKFNGNQIYEYNLKSQKRAFYYLHETEQKDGDNETMSGNYIKDSKIVSDPVTGNVFFIHENNGIYVCNLDKERCVEILEPQSEKRSNLFLSPNYSYMFWIEGANTMMALMDGQNVTIGAEANNVDFIVIGVNTKNEVISPLMPDTSSIFYSNCRIYAINSTTGILTVNHFNTKVEEVGKREPTDKLIMDSEPLNETLALKNPCKNLPCADGICVSHRTREIEGAKCLRNLAFEIKKVEIDGNQFAYAEKFVALPNNGSKNGARFGWSYFFISAIVLAFTSMI